MARPGGFGFFLFLQLKLFVVHVVLDVSIVRGFLSGFISGFLAVIVGLVRHFFSLGFNRFFVSLLGVHFAAFRLENVFISLNFIGFRDVLVSLDFFRFRSVITVFKRRILCRGFDIIAREHCIKLIEIDDAVIVFIDLCHESVDLRRWKIGEVEAQQATLEFGRVDGAVVVFIEFIEQLTDVDARVRYPLTQNINDVVGHKEDAAGRASCGIERNKSIAGAAFPQLVFRYTGKLSPTFRAGF